MSSLEGLSWISIVLGFVMAEIISIDLIAHLSGREIHIWN